MNGLRIALFSALLAGATSAQPLPDPRLDLYEFASDRELVRYAAADCALVVDPNDLWSTLNGDYLLQADPWTSLNVGSNEHPIEVPLCPDIRFFGQPSVGRGGIGSVPSQGRGGSCILVGPDLVLTAGHLFQFPNQCGDRAVIFDFAVSAPPEHGGGELHPYIVPEENVYFCAEAIEIAYPHSADWTLFRLDRPVSGRKPLKIRRADSVAPGTPVANVGHPDRLPFKAETGVVSSASPTFVSSPMHVRVGSSGSMLVNRLTGKVEGNATSGGFAYLPRPGETCYEPCPTAGCFNAFFTGILSAADSIPPIGLQVKPATEAVIEQRGPVGGPFTNPSIDYELSVGLEEGAPVRYSQAPADPSPWAVMIDEEMPPYLLEPGEMAIFTVALGPAAYELGPTRLDRQISILDKNYQARELKNFRLVVGFDGFTLAPADPFAGDGPGAQPHESKAYSVTGRYLSPVGVKVSASDSWISVNGSATPIVVTPSGLGASQPVTLAFATDGSDLANGVYVGSVRFEQLPENGEWFERAVRLDFGRRFYPASGLPVGIGSEPVEIPIAVDEQFELLDVDLELEVELGGFELNGSLQLISPAGTVLPLGTVLGGSRIWDDETNPPPGGGSLSDLEGEKSAGLWRLRVDLGSSGPATVTGLTLRLTPVEDP